MAYLSTTPAEERAMLSQIGVPSLQTLVDQIPRELQVRGGLKMPPALTEMELEARMASLAARNVDRSRRACFLGGGAYDHYIPSVVDEITSRGEFYTAYTPYQAEASQGSLQAFFEYQSLICLLTGMDVANASLYEGGSAVCEAVLMAMRVTDRRGKVVLSAGLHPEYAQVVRTYVESIGGTVVAAPLTEGVTNLAALAPLIDAQTACVVVQSPNVLGFVEDVSSVSRLAHDQQALSVMSFDPLSLGLLKSPASQGADLAVAEGQCLGIPLQYGGPYLGILACRGDYVRKMPGRLIGQTVDRRGNRCFVLNLQAREQHIRRDKATSNICTNQGLMALRAAVYLSLLGPQGLREVGELCCQKAHYAAEAIARVPGYRLLSRRPFFKEFVVLAEAGADEALAMARHAGLDVGPALSRLPNSLGLDDATRRQAFLVAVTENRTKAEIDRLVAALGSL